MGEVKDGVILKNIIPVQYVRGSISEGVLNIEA
jgi:hypothetical protein